MSRRQLVPAALRAELTEYSSLLRALRTANTLDLTTHLTESREHSSSPFDDDERHASTPSTNSDSTSSDTPHWRKRDHWTRWPIPAKDVPLPYWSLQDELGSILKQVLTSIEPESDDEEGLARRKGGTDIESDSESEDEETYMQELAKLLTPVVEDLHEAIFALICAHTVARPDSMQNRIEPLDWHDLVNILGSPAAAHIIDETTLQNVVARMETICETTPAPASASNPIPPTLPSTALHRRGLVKASRSNLISRLSAHTTSLFEQNLPPPNYEYLSMEQVYKKKLKRKPRTRKNKAAKAERRSSPTDSGEEEHQETESDDSDEMDWVGTESDSAG